MAIIKAGFEARPQGPKLIGGYVDGTTDAFPTVKLMLGGEGWTDVGACEAVCESKPEQRTCHTNHAPKKSRIDYLFANRLLMPATPKFGVDNEDTFPSHKPPGVKAKVTQMSRSLRTVGNTNFSTLFEDKSKPK